MFLWLIGIDGWKVEMVFIAALILFLCGQSSNFRCGLKKGIRGFRDAADRTGIDAGHGTRGIFGKRAAEALTVDNNNVELYDPPMLEDSLGKPKFGWVIAGIALVALIVFAVFLIARNLQI